MKQFCTIFRTVRSHEKLLVVFCLPFYTVNGWQKSALRTTHVQSVSKTINLHTYLYEFFFNVCKRKHNSYEREIRQCYHSSRMLSKNVVLVVQYSDHVQLTHRYSSQLSSHHSHLATSSIKKPSFLREVFFVARRFLLVHSRLEAFVDEHEVRARRESLPRSKQQWREILMKTRQCWRLGAPLISPYQQLNNENKGVSV